MKNGTRDLRQRKAARLRPSQREEGDRLPWWLFAVPGCDACALRRPFGDAHRLLHERMYQETVASSVAEIKNYWRTAPARSKRWPGERDAALLCEVKRLVGRGRSDRAVAMILEVDRGRVARIRESLHITPADVRRFRDDLDGSPE